MKGNGKMKFLYQQFFAAYVPIERKWKRLNNRKDNGNICVLRFFNFGQESFVDCFSLERAIA